MVKKMKTTFTKQNKLQKTKILNTKWKKIKLKGNVIAEANVGLEGLIGLEVLENYDSSLVGTAKNNLFAGSCKKSSKFIDEIIHKNSKKPTKLKKQKLQCNDHKRKDRFHLLRPPPEEAFQDSEFNDCLEDTDELPHVEPTKLDDLSDWNGLGVPKIILKALAEKEFYSPTEIQTLTLPAAIMGRKDILGAAETGSGKTLAFGIPVLAGIMELKKKKSYETIRKPLKSCQQNDTMNSEIENTQKENKSKGKNCRNALYALILTPTRELAVQVRDHIIDAAKYTDIQVVAIFGGLSVEKQERILNKCPEIIVATPGRFWEMYQQDHKHLRHLDRISFLVIDETDRMLEKGHFDELRNILQVLNADELRKQCRQNFVFSATLTLVPEHMQKKNAYKRKKYRHQTSESKLQDLIHELGISQPKIVDVTRKQQTAENLTECRLICSILEKDYYLYYFVQRYPGRTIVFCNSIDCVKRLATLFSLLQCNALPLHANMAQKQRLKNLERFRDNIDGLLIATDVAARGLDIPNVEHVLHYQVPRTSENYIHRSGRTARASKNGITVIFMEPSEVRSYIKLCKTLQRNEDLPLFPISSQYFQAVKERVNLARDVDKEELKLKRSQSEIGWIKKNAEEMDIIIDDYNDETDSNEDEDLHVIERKKNRQYLNEKRLQLRSLLSKPIFPKGFSYKYPTSTGLLKIPELSLDMNDENDVKCNNAIKAVKTSIEMMKQAKKLRNKKQRNLS